MKGMYLNGAPAYSFSQKQRPSTLMAIPSGPEGIAITLDKMRDFVRIAKVNPEIRALAMQIIADVPQKAWSQQISELFAFVRDKVRYVHDVNEVETVQSPEATLAMGGGDCDDKATLLAALLESVGHPARLVAVAFTGNEFEHVFTETRYGPGWMALDTTEPVAAGWSPPGVSARMVRNI